MCTCSRVRNGWCQNDTFSCVSGGRNGGRCWCCAARDTRPLATIQAEILCHKNGNVWLMCALGAHLHVCARPRASVWLCVDAFMWGACVQARSANAHRHRKCRQQQRRKKNDGSRSDIQAVRDPVSVDSVASLLDTTLDTADLVCNEECDGSVTTDTTDEPYSPLFAFEEMHWGRDGGYVCEDALRASPVPPRIVRARPPSPASSCSSEDLPPLPLYFK